MGPYRVMDTTTNQVLVSDAERDQAMAEGLAAFRRRPNNVIKVEQWNEEHKSWGTIRTFGGFP